MRGTTSNVFVDGWQAIEACAIARICQRSRCRSNLAQPPLLDRKEARLRFSSRQLFPKDKALLSQLGKDFDFCSKQAHTSLHSTATKLANSIKKYSSDLSFRHCEIQRLGDLLSPFFWIVQTHFRILKVFRGGLSVTIGFIMDGHSQRNYRPSRAPRDEACVNSQSPARMA